jgi:hypothetical protein
LVVLVEALVREEAVVPVEAEEPAAGSVGGGGAGPVVWPLLPVVGWGVGVCVCVCGREKGVGVPETGRKSHVQIINALSWTHPPTHPQPTRNPSPFSGSDSGADGGRGGKRSVCRASRRAIRNSCASCCSYPARCSPDACVHMACVGRVLGRFGAGG